MGLNQAGPLPASRLGCRRAANQRWGQQGSEGGFRAEMQLGSEGQQGGQGGQGAPLHLTPWFMPLEWQ